MSFNESKSVNQGINNEDTITFITGVKQTIGQDV